MIQKTVKAKNKQTAQKMIVLKNDLERKNASTRNMTLTLMTVIVSMKGKEEKRRERKKRRGRRNIERESQVVKSQGQIMIVQIEDKISILCVYCAEQQNMAVTE